MLAAIFDLDALSSSDVVAIASVAVAAVGVYFAARYAKEQIASAQEQLQAAREQLEQQAQTTRGEFLLSLHERFRDHDKIHLKLRNQPADYKWWSGPEPTGDEWAEVEAYMGLFERVWMLVQGKSVDIDVIERLYGYRIENIVTNDKIRTIKLEDEGFASYWTDFIELWRAVEDVHVKRRGSALCAAHPAPTVPRPRGKAHGGTVDPLAYIFDEQA